MELERAVGILFGDHGQVAFAEDTLPLFQILADLLPQLRGVQQPVLLRRLVDQEMKRPEFLSAKECPLGFINIDIPGITALSRFVVLLPLGVFAAIWAPGLGRDDQIVLSFRSEFWADHLGAGRACL